MNTSDAATLLALAAAFDNRTIGREQATAWATALNPTVTVEDGSTVIAAHYAHTREWIMPSDINAGVAAIRKARLVNVAQLEPVADPDDPRAFAAELAAARREVADGRREVPPLPPARVLPGVRRGLASLGSGIAEVRAGLTPQETA